MAYIRGNKVLFSAKMGGGSDKLNSLLDGSITEITPEDLEGVFNLRNYAFAGCSLVSAEIPDSVINMGTHIFSNCKSLTSVVLPNNITSLSSQTFYYCEKLKDITLPSGLTSIGSYVFQYCKALEEITIPESVTSIGNTTFSG